jgi:translation initiation factor IF-3
LPNKREHVIFLRLNHNLKLTTTLSPNNTRINQGIRAAELRVIGPEGENIGVVTLKEALARAAEVGLDLIEISPNAVPPQQNLKFAIPKLNQSR